MPPHSTENHVARAMRNHGWDVEQVQENDISQWGKMADALTDATSEGLPDLVLWTRTGWAWEHLGWSHNEAMSAQALLRVVAGRRHVPVIGYHLDIWWGLKREVEVSTEQFFDVDILITADGGHDDRWVEAGVNHVWFPPAISAAEAHVGQHRDEFASRIAFVGSHDGGYHPEHQHRHQLVAWLKTEFGRSGENAVRFWPEPGRHAIRGRDLQDLYASVDVVVGDSAFAGTGLSSYCSDRVPETTGRGGFLLHPRVPGVTDGSLWRGVPMWTEGETIACWDAGNWDELRSKIDYYLNNVDQRREIARAGRALTTEHHTYERRIAQLEAVLLERGLLR